MYPRPGTRWISAIIAHLSATTCILARLARLVRLVHLALASPPSPPPESGKTGSEHLVVPGFTSRPTIKCEGLRNQLHKNRERHTPIFVNLDPFNHSSFGEHPYRFLFILLNQSELKIEVNPRAYLEKVLNVTMVQQYRVRLGSLLGCVIPRCHTNKRERFSPEIRILQ
jgi:hypothetical protein